MEIRETRSQEHEAKERNTAEMENGRSRECDSCEDSQPGFLQQNKQTRFFVTVNMTYYVSASSNELVYVQHFVIHKSTSCSKCHTQDRIIVTTSQT